jgi:hypothetical protein
MLKMVDSKDRFHGFTLVLCHLVQVWPWADYDAELWSSFLWNMDNQITSFLEILHVKEANTYIPNMKGFLAQKVSTGMLALSFSITQFLMHVAWQA